MAFEITETETKANGPPTALIRYMRSKPRGKSGQSPKPYDRAKARPALVITIPTTICGLSKEERYHLLIGSGADKGKLRIVGSKDKKAIKPTSFKYANTWRFGYVPKLGDEIFDGERCPVRRISDSVFEIDVPVSWFGGGDG